MAFLIFGLFWMATDHAPWWVMALFTLFQLIESIPTDVSGEQTRWEIRNIYELLKERQ